MRVSPGGGSKPSPRFLAVGGTRSRPPAADCADLEVGGRAVDAEDRRAFAEHDLQVGRRESEQQFVRPELFLLGPYRHGQGGNEKEQDVGEQSVQLVEVRQVVQEEPLLPKRRGGAQQDEQGQEDVPRRIREVHAEVPPHEGRHHAAADVRDFLARRLHARGDG